MKQFKLLMMYTVLAFGLAACGGAEDDKSQAETSKAASTQEKAVKSESVKNDAQAAKQNKEVTKETAKQEVVNKANETLNSVADVLVSIAPKELAISLTAPAEAIIGINREPESKEEEARYESVTKGFNEGMPFALNDDAKCAITQAGGGLLAKNKQGIANLSATWKIKCEAMDKVNAVTTELFKQFPKLSQAKISWLSIEGGSMKSIKKDQTIELK